MRIRIGLLSAAASLLLQAVAFAGHGAALVIGNSAYRDAELVTANAKNLREANKTIREEMERGVFDIEAVKEANAELIATIEESLQIADEGKAKRAAAEEDLQKMEAELKTTLAAAKARKDGIGTNSGESVPD